MSGRGKFFAVDARQVPKACALGMPEGVSYLIVAAGTGRTNRISTWSANAIERYTGISRTRANYALQRLRDANLLATTGHWARPRHELLPAQPADEIIPWLWLPLSLLLDRTQGSPPASLVELVRQSGDPLTLQLLVEAYGAHDLLGDGGIDRTLIWAGYERQLVGEYAEYDIWAFRQTNSEHMGWGPLTEPHRLPSRRVRRGVPLLPNEDASAFWPRWRTLTALHAVEVVPTLFEGGQPGAEAIHALGGVEPERQMGVAAHAAAIELLAVFGSLSAPPNAWLCPVPRHVGGVCVKGVFRLRHRPRTGATQQWYAKVTERAAEWDAHYLALRQRAALSGGLREAR